MISLGVASAGDGPSWWPFDVHPANIASAAKSDDNADPTIATRLVALTVDHGGKL